MLRTACVVATLLLSAGAFGPTARAIGAASTGEIARAVGQDGGTALNAVYAARRYAPLWTGSREAQTRLDTLVALLKMESAADPAAAADSIGELDGAGAASDVTLEVSATRAAIAYLVRRSGAATATTAKVLKAFQRLGDATPSGPLATALLHLELVRDLGGWSRVGTVPGPLPTVPPAAVASPEVDVAPALPRRKTLPEPVSLRQRLAQSSDLPASERGRLGMDDGLTAAVRRFQARHGLLADGVVGGRTLAALNAPVARQIVQVRLNMARGTPDRSGLARYVVVNVPGFELRVIDEGEVVLRSRVIVGEKDNKTPIFDDRIRFIEINPSWFVPDSIVPELIEKEALRPGFLAKDGFRWRGSSEPGAKQTLVQRPGPENALGRIKFLFPNHYNVYLHDTPQRKLFGRSQRSLSHGCVRVEKPNELALALLAGQGWDARRLEAAYQSRRTQRVELVASVPVFLDYQTAFVDDDGQLQLRPDLYGYDRAGITVFNGKGLLPEPYVAADEAVPPGIRTPHLVPVVAATPPAS
jgi:murein L,D-transpeptidase YcbB/YkuD